MLANFSFPEDVHAHYPINLPGHSEDHPYAVWDIQRRVDELLQPYLTAVVSGSEQANICCGCFPRFGRAAHQAREKVLLRQKLQNILKNIFKSRDEVLSYLNANSGCIVSDPGGRYIESNAPFLASLGYTKLELEGFSYSDLVQFDDQAKVFHAQMSFERTGEPQSYEVQLIHKNGSLVHFKAIVSGICNAEFKIICYATRLQAITGLNGEGEGLQDENEKQNDQQIEVLVRDRQPPLRSALTRERPADRHVKFVGVPVTKIEPVGRVRSANKQGKILWIADKVSRSLWTRIVSQTAKAQLVEGGIRLQEALQEGGDLNLVVIDLDHHSLDILEVIQSIKANHSTVPIVGLSSKMQGRSVRKAHLESGLTKHMTAPFALKELLSHIKSA